MITTGVEAVTEVVVMVKVALTPPTPIVTLAGTEAAGLLLESLTTAVSGVAAAKVTVPVEEVPPATLVGLTVSLFNTDEVGEFTVICANRVTSPRVAEKLIVVAETLNVVTVNVALEAPAGMVTFGGPLAELGS